MAHPATAPVFVTVTDRIEVEAPFVLKDDLKAIPGRRWNPDTRRWTYPISTTSAEAIARLCKRAGRPIDSPDDDRWHAILEEARAAWRDRKAARDADTTPDVADILPDVPGRHPAWNHQRRAFLFARNRQGSFLAMDMGTGKSRTATGLLDAWDAKLVLIIAPTNVTRVWPREFRTHSLRDWRCESGATKAKRTSVAKRAARARVAIDAGRVAGLPTAIIATYESCWREPLADLLLETPWDAVIVDECHRAKSPGGRGSLYLARLTERVRANGGRILGLTGTLMPHSPLDVYAQARMIDPGVFGTSNRAFKLRYAILDPRIEGRVLGFRNQDDLANRLGTMAYQCKADEVLDLPDAIDTVRTCDLEPAAQRAVDELADELQAQLAEGTVTAANGAVKVLRFQQATGGYLPLDAECVDEGVDRLQQISTAKRDLLKDVIADIQPAPDGGHEPVVVFCRFSADLANVRAVAAELGRSYAELSGKSRDALDDNAHLAAGVDIAGVQIQSGGVGIDLTRARYAIYYSVGHSLGDYLQSRKRLHRPGQTRSVVYVHLVAAGTYDEDVYTALERRENIVETVLRAARDRNEQEAA